MRSLLCLIPFLCLLAACVSEPPQPGKGTASGIALANKRMSLDARAQIQNKIEKKTYTVTLEAVAVEPSALRLDVSAGFGTEIGKLTLNGDKVTVLLPQQKKAYMGLVSENSLRPLLPVKIDPRDLLHFLTGAIPKNWTCNMQTLELEVCTDPNKVLTLQHDPRLDQPKSRWTVSSDKFAMTVLPSDVKTNVQVKPELFSLIIPDGYSKHKLP